MTAHNKKEDRRVRRTKMLLTHALTGLMQQKQINEISVKELAELADINRGTFYLYYKDIYDMLAKIEDNMFTTLENIIAKHEHEGLLTGIRPLLNDTFEFISENRDMCKVLLSPNGDMSFLHRLDSFLREKCRVFWQEQNLTDDIAYDYYYSFCVFGCTGLIHAWLSYDCHEPPESMAALTEKMLMRGSLSAD